MPPRLASAALVSALIRLVHDCGGHAVVIRKGDPEAGDILIEMLENGRYAGLWDRIAIAGDRRTWQRNERYSVENQQEISAYRQRRLTVDRDLWVIELDVADATRFADGMPTGD